MPSRLGGVTDATEATAPIEQNAIPSAEEADAAITAFRNQLEGQVSVPATLVQDCLLDVWAKLPEGEPRSEVERWLTETLERQLYVVADVDARLESVFSDN